MNQFFISFNLILSIIVTVISVNPAVQEVNPKSGLAQSGMVVAYTAYLVTSAIANHDDEKGGGSCNPLQERAASARNGMIVLGAIFTFLAIAYSTSRAATQSFNLIGNGKKGNSGGGDYGPISLGGEESGLGTISEQPTGEISLRTRAIMAAIAAGQVDSFNFFAKLLILPILQITTAISSGRGESTQLPTARWR